MTRDFSSSAGTTGPAAGWPWYLAAILCCLVVFMLNAGPLVYFDTAGYLSKGAKFISFLEVSPEVGAGNGAGAGAGAAQAPPPDVDGTHSTVYAMMISILAWLGVLEGMVLVNTFLVLGTVWLIVRVVLRDENLFHSAVAPLTAIPIMVASLTSLPFYTAFLMPDIFTPILILLVALLTVYTRSMRGWEIAGAMILSVVAVSAHLSHLGIVALLVPVALLGGVLLGGRWWLPPLLVGLLLAAGLADKRLFEASVEGIAGAQVVYKPFITARLIEDGPGLEYLNTYCPDDTIPTCALWEALQWSDDPYRLTASHIIFERNAQLGSFQRMDPEARRQVAQAQRSFFLRVLADAPVATTLAFTMNMLDQAQMASIRMTLPSEAILERLQEHRGLALSEFGQGRITADPSWLGAINQLHNAIYILSAVSVLALLIWPGALSGSMRVLILMVVAGVLINALVCGGVSQPAPRYGARVAWLLPLIASLGFLFSRARRA